MCCRCDVCVMCGGCICGVCVMYVLVQVRGICEFEVFICGFHVVYVHVG